ncbi:MAG: hypothetical protein JXR33_04400 [Coriobacteriia bacterium]|nr:hypothetical protein [Coriobacteriia bacterium]
MILTSRQSAGLVWLVIFFVWAMTRAEIRSSVRGVVSAFFTPKLLALFGVIIGYNVAVVWWLSRVGYWDASMLYDTVAFIAIGGVGSVSKAATQGVTYDSRFFAKTVLVNLELMVLFAFFSEFFPFNFWVEFLVVIPLVTLLGMLVVVSEYQKGSEQVHRLLTNVQAGTGFLLLGWVGWQVYQNIGQLLHLQVLLSLGLPFVMSLFFVPVLFFACAVFAYEDAFLIVTFKQQDKRLARWKKRRLFLRFGLMLKRLQTFRRSPTMHQYAWVKSREEARDILKSWTGSVPAYDGEDD